MPDFIGQILWPLRWIVETILVGWHWLFAAIGMDPNSGLTWVLSVVGLVLVIRAALIPIFVRQIHNQRQMLEVAPQLKKIQDKYKGKRDQISREAMSRETMELYRKTGTNPLSSCLPMIIQIPVFFSLYTVLRTAAEGQAGTGLLNLVVDGEPLYTSFGASSLFGVAPLKQSFQGALADHQIAVMVIAAILVVLMIASQFITQLQIVSKNISPEVKASPTFRQQRMLMYFLPFAMLFSGYAFPLGVIFYWLTTNIWTMVQQYIVIRNMPTPGTEAAKAREARLARRRRAAVTAEVAAEGDLAILEEAPPRPTTQRRQPVSKNRTKRKR